MWKDGTIARRTTLPATDAEIVDMTRDGTGVATGYLQNHQASFGYADGRFTRLRGSGVGAIAINEAGVIVGGRGGSPGGVPVRWASASAAPVRLPLPAGATEGSASNIAEDGTILGSVGRAGKSATAYLWFPGGTGRYLPLSTVDGGRRATSFAPSAISNGWVTGNAVVETEQSTASTPMRYRITTGEFQRLPADLWSAEKIAADGWVAAEGLDLSVTGDAGRRSSAPAGVGGDRPDLGQAGGAGGGRRDGKPHAAHPLRREPHGQRGAAGR
ncbi:hypothetical protein ACWT_1367 [Actinoplanes sp. SE50]|nr:hypothetical protein ACPL_1488 [Actinoplanes sp. SE50/110]ATO80782.1 hypothetical protein ACWT_1367 [Actinoplanes sp. SE50]SLL98190.1 hypothetical protein ACSP50_1414 [Actinoplanes sp. SE50/110]